MMDIFWKELWINLRHCRVILILIFAWPFFVTVVVKLWGQSRNGECFGPLEALYYSLATYAGVGVPESNPTRHKWPKLIHRLIGILAWAFVTAFFVTTITS